MSDEDETVEVSLMRGGPQNMTPEQKAAYEMFLAAVKNPEFMASVAHTSIGISAMLHHECLELLSKQAPELVEGASAGKAECQHVHIQLLQEMSTAVLLRTLAAISTMALSGLPPARREEALGQRVEAVTQNFTMLVASMLGDLEPGTPTLQ